MACFHFFRIGALCDFDQNNVVKLQPLDLPDVRDVHAGLERKILVVDATQVGHLTPLETVVVKVGLFGVAGDDRDGSAGLGHRKLTQGLSQKSHRVPRVAALKELNWRSMTGSNGGIFRSKRPQHMTG
jgi:hypothetical protein